VPGPFNANREHVDATILAFEAHGFDVVPISAAQQRLKLLQEVNPAAVVYMPHGRLTVGEATEAEAWLAERNIPLFAPLTIFEEESHWRGDQRSFDGGMLSMSVTLPELDGAVAPMATVAQQRDDNGYKVFRALPAQLDRYARWVKQAVALKTKANSDKKLAIYYFKGPGQSALAAGDLEVTPSLYAFLQHLKRDGWNVDGLPASEAGFAQLLQQRGPVIGPYARGDFAQFLKNADPALVSTQQLQHWCSAHPELCEQVTTKFGPPPGQYLRTDDAVAVARVELGHVVLLPQPLPGIGDDTFKLVHGTHEAPPWPYLASYLWTKETFKPDAIMHFGTHGSLEFTPWKQVGLSDLDWPDALIGDVPHGYVYTMSNVGEAMIAKRRSYATIISHLTPPFMEGGAQSAHKQLSDHVADWERATSPALKAEHARDLQREAIAIGLHRDLNLPEDGAWSEAQLQQLAEHLELMQHANVAAGLYTLGTPYAREALETSVNLMGRDPLMQALAELDVARGKARLPQLQSERWLSQHYRGKADQLMAQIHAGRAPDAVLASVVTRDELARAEAWKSGAQVPSDDDLIRGLIAMGNAAPAAIVAAEAADHATLQQHLVRVLAAADSRDYLIKLESDDAFQRAASTLDPEALANARKVARAIPAMGKALEIATRADMRALIAAMQTPATRTQILAWARDKDFLLRAAEEAEREVEREREALTLRVHTGLAHLPDGDPAQLSDHALHAASSTLDVLLNLADPPPALKAELERERPRLTALSRAITAEQQQREAAGRRFAEAVLSLRERLTAMPHWRGQLATSPRQELGALSNFLGGGFIRPSSGGDALINPAALPTGRNLYAIDAEKTPSAQAWRVGRQLVDQLLAEHRQKHDGAYPQKIAITLWAGDFIHTEGSAFAQILYLLGVEPVRDPFGRVAQLKLIDRDTLGRPRIDVVVQTSGQIRDLAASRLYLIQRAVEMAAQAREADNAVAASVAASERALKEQGLAPADARRYASARVFGGVNGSYGTNIMGLVESGSRWQTDADIADTYLNNMGAVFGEGDLWGAFAPGILAAALDGTEAVVQPLESNTWGPISLDHVYEFMGGLNLAVRHVTGNDPAAYFSDFRNPARPSMREAGATIAVEARATLLNPAWIEAMTQGGASSAESFAETFRNVYGWNVMKPDAIKPELWDDLHRVYVEDEGRAHEFFERENPYALQEMTAVMLETARKGYWQPDAEVLQSTARLHANLVAEHGSSGTEFVNANPALSAFIAEHLDTQTRPAYENALQQANEGGTIDTERGLVLSKQDDTPLGAEQTQSNPGQSEPAPKRADEANEVKRPRQFAVSKLAVLLLLAGLALVIIWLRRRHTGARA